MAHITTGERLMVLSRDRVFYQGWLGRGMQPRRIGAAMIYAATQGQVQLRSGAGRSPRRAVAVAMMPYERHQLTTADGHIIAVCIEPERIDARALAALCAGINSGPEADAMARRMRAAAGHLGRDDGGCAAAFDRRVLGRPLAQRRLDPRILSVLDRIDSDPGAGPVSAEDCAAMVGLSASRFLHLFKDETGVSFRNLRMWKRARRFLEHAVQDTSLTEVALDLGYPDSSHFSHSIRKIYGLMPRHIRQGSRGLTVIGPAVAGPT